MSPGPCNRPGGARGMQHATKSIAPVAVCELACHGSELTSTCIVLNIAIQLINCTPILSHDTASSETATTGAIDFSACC